jgi:DnaK suppressor protein
VLKHSKVKKTKLQKPAKKQGLVLKQSLVEECKKKLIEKYNELVNITHKTEDIIPDVGDDIDLAKNVLDKEILQELTDTQQSLLNLISIALEKINRGTYGICESCNKPIAVKRIKVLPWARYCIKCQTNDEHS